MSHDTATPEKNLVPDEILEQRAHIPDGLYQEIHYWTPIPTADFVVTRDNGKEDEFLLALRTEEPFKDTWFIPGGRINYGDTMLNAIARQAMREVGLDIFNPNQVESCEFVGPFDVLNPASEGGSKRPEWHSIWMLHEIKVTADAKVSAHAENAEIRWFTSIPADCPLPVKVALRCLGFEDAP